MKGRNNLVSTIRSEKRMEIRIRPLDGDYGIIAEIGKSTVFHFYVNDQVENAIDIIFTKEQMQEIKKEINSRTDID